MSQEIKKPTDPPQLTPETEGVWQQLHSDWSEARHLLERLVRTNSHTRNMAGVDANAEILIQQFAPLGFQPRRLPSKDPHYASHLILDNHSEGPVILFVGHLDTVFTPEDQAGFSAITKTPEGFLRGPGTVDIKGGSVMMWMVLRALSAGLRAPLPPVRFILAWNSSEEELGPDFSESVVRDLSPPVRACLVFEADNVNFSGQELVAARKGIGQWKIEVRGRSVHSGNSHADGLNAIVRLSEIIGQISRLTNYDRGLTLNVGIIRGGTSTNRVPEHAEAKLEVRFRDPADYEAVRQSLLAFKDQGCFEGPRKDHRCEVSIEPVREISSWNGDHATESLIAFWQEAGESCGLPVSVGSRGGLSDANYFGRHYPTLDGLGPRGGNFHTMERLGDAFVITEYVEPESFFTKSLVNVLAIRRLLLE